MSEPGAPERPPASVRSTLTGWARKLGDWVAEARGVVPVPEALVEPLARAAEQRMAGEFAAADRTARDVSTPGHPHALLARALAACWTAAFDQRAPTDLDEVHPRDQELPSLANELGAAARALAAREPLAVLDAARHAQHRLDVLPPELRAEVELSIACLRARAHLQRGHLDRAVRELHRARASMPIGLAPRLRRAIVALGVETLLAEDEIDEAERWLQAATDLGELPEEWAQILAAQGDDATAMGLVEAIADVGAAERLRLRVALSTPAGFASAAATGAALQELAGRVARRSPDGDAQRWWALAQLRVVGRPAALDDEILAALERATTTAPEGLRPRHVDELAHVALRLDRHPGLVQTQVEAAFAAAPLQASDEVRLCVARGRLEGGDPAMLDDPALWMLGDAESHGPPGPDATSPLRDAVERAAVRTCARELLRAERLLGQGDATAAAEALVDALVARPEHRRARERLQALAAPAGGQRLEDRLHAATSLLSSLPARIEGVSLAGVQDGLAGVVAARERLARPLVVAIMGEFSAGKSTFVNALLGEAVAPMGVLPTTSTINVFRRGSHGGARIHYRDGSLTTVAPTEVEAFLHGLDDVEAARIRHVEIERTGGRMGEAMVVDTPGLNALDAFHEQVAREFLQQADAAVWVFSATRGAAASEAELLAELRASGRRVLGVLNKVDVLEPGEREQLGAYLREQLGEVLVEVVPLDARRALSFRTGAHPEGEADPFAEVERALEHHFFSRARELKREVTTRRLGEALAIAGDALVGAADALDARGGGQSAIREHTRAARDALHRHADAMVEGLLALDDVLLREMLATKVLDLQQGARPLAGEDAGYLEATVRNAVRALLRRTLVDLAVDPAAAEVVAVLRERLLPWAEGRLDGELAAGMLPQLLAEAGRVRGEAAMRATVRESLRRTAAAFRRRARGLARAVAERVAIEHRGQSRAVAEALRLRLGVLPAVRALAEPA